MQLNLSIDYGVGRRGGMMAKHHAWESKLLPGYTGFGDQFKDYERPYNKLKDNIIWVYHLTYECIQLISFMRLAWHENLTDCLHEHTRMRELIRAKKTVYMCGDTF